MRVVERFQRRVRRLDQQIQAALRQLYMQVRDSLKDVAHRHVEGVLLVERQAAQVVDEVTIETRAVVVILLDELRGRQAQRVARFGLY